MASMNNVYAVVLAGGSGTRFWPKSRHLTPKQLCAIGDAEKTMIEITLDRLEGLIPPERRIIVTHQDQAKKTKEIVGKKVSKVLAEPQARNTAAALALAALEIQSTHTGSEKPIMISLHADAVIRKVDVFRDDLVKASTVAATGNICLLGVKPEYPETGYGYIEAGDSIAEVAKTGARTVKSFREKPDLETAKKYLSSGKFLWNAGMFVWEVPTIITEMERFIPNIVGDLAKLLTKRGQSFLDVKPDILAQTYGQLPKIAIDNAVFEVSKRIATISCDFGWQDVGSWDALSQCFATDKDGNLKYGDMLLFDTKNTTVDTDGPFVGCIGLNNMVVVAAKGAVLVCPKERSQEVKKIVEALQSAGRKELL